MMEDFSLSSILFVNDHNSFGIAHGTVMDFPHIRTYDPDGVVFGNCAERYPFLYLMR